MRKLSISVVLDTLFFSFCVFLISLIIFGYALPQNLRLILSGTVSATSTVFIFKLLKQKDSVKRKTKAEQKHFNEVITQLNFMSSAELLAFMKSVFDKAEIECEIVNGYLHFPKEKRIVLFKYGFRSVGKVDIVRAYNKLKRGYHAQIFSESFDAETKRFASLFNGDIVLKDANYLYLLLCAYDIYPQIKINLAKPKLTLKNIKEGLLNKSKRKSYLGFGLFFLVFGYFSPIKWYYLTSGLVMLGLCISSVLFGTSNQIKE